MAIKRVESSTLAQSPANKDAGKNVIKRRYTEREIALKKLAIKLGMTRDDMRLYLGLR